MRIRAIAQLSVLLSLLIYAGTGHSEPSIDSEAGRAQGTMDLFGPVFEIMTMEAAKDSMGCRGCHIGPDAFVPWGMRTVDTQEETLQQLEQERPDLLQGGRFGSLGELVHSGEMPRIGLPWTQDQLDLLDAWLITYE